MTKSYTIIATHSDIQQVDVAYADGALRRTLSIPAPDPASLHAQILAYWPTADFARMVDPIDYSGVSVGVAVPVADNEIP
jgi:hypothetical protein